MKIRVLNWKNKQALSLAKKVILNGGILVYPTDTIYGFGINAKNLDAINNLNLIKNRKGPISVIAEDKKKASNWINLPQNEMKAALEHLKARTTIIYPVKKNIVDNKILGPNSTLGIRVPDHPFCTSLSNYCNVPITTTSVNRAGDSPKLNVDEILNSFKSEVDLIIEDGELISSASKIYVYGKSSLENIR